MPRANLTYYIFEGLLVGILGGRTVAIPVVSGGAAGATLGAYKAEECPSGSGLRRLIPSLANNPYATGVKTPPAPVGGPIPVAVYDIGVPYGAGNARRVRLTPVAGNGAFAQATGGRGGFLIHHTGPRGSDGCLVPRCQGDFEMLMDGLAQDLGGKLFVLETIQGDRFA